MSKKFSVFLLLFVLVNGVSAYFTELYEDESYYWLYSEFLAWGYFDHPPMVALIIKLGYAIFPNEFGVRIIGILLTAGSLFIIGKMVNVKNELLFGLLIFGSVTYGLLQGFIFTPDIPLLFFTVLFLYQFRLYLEDDSFKRVIYLSIINACLLYSKYNGILLIGFAVLANLSLLRKKSFWLITLFTIVLMLPHIHWQWANNFPSLSYHMVERSTNRYKIQYTTDYFFGAPAFMGPLVFFTLIIPFFKKKELSTFEKTLRFTTIATWLTFFFLTFKGRVELNWVIVALPPLLIFSYSYIEENVKLTKWTKILAIPSIVVFTFLRIYFITDIPVFQKTLNIKPKRDRAARMKGQRVFAEKVKEFANGTPIVTHSYQRAAALSFYTKTYIPVVDPRSRRSQFDIWRFQDDYAEDQDVIFVGGIESDTLLVAPPQKEYYLKRFDNLAELVPLLK